MKHFKLICFILFGLITCSCNGHVERKNIPVEIDELSIYKGFNETYVNARVYSPDLGYSFNYRFPIEMYDELLDVFESKTLSSENKIVYITYEIWVKDPKPISSTNFHKKKHKKSKYSY